MGGERRCIPAVGACQWRDELREFVESEGGRRRGIDPYEYLRDVLERILGTLAKDLDSLTPSGWAVARAKKQTLAA